jgi:tRNA(adenine34) deaminase
LPSDSADRDPDVLAAAGLVVGLVDLGLDRAVGDALDGDAVLQPVELGLGGVAERPGAIAADPGVAGRFQGARQLAVIGQQQQAFGVQVQAADRDQARQVLGQRLEHRRPALGVVVGGHQPGGLVIAEDPRRLALGHQLAVDGEEVARADLDRRGGQHLAVDRHATGFDQPLDLAPRGHAGPRQGLGDALAGAAVEIAVLTVEFRLVQGIVWLGHFRRPSRAGRISRWAFQVQVMHTDQDEDQGSEEDRRMMRLALDAARAAARAGETPVGAVILDPKSGEVIAVAGNGPIAAHDPTAHAEIAVLRAAAAKLENYRLTDLTLVVTLEPCAMCAGAISHARIGRVVFGAEDPKGGAVVHGPKFFALPTCHWRPQVTGGVLAEESAELLRGFFRARRKKT